MRVVVTGASGFLGARLVAALQAAGHQVTKLVRRRPAAADELQWNPSGAIDAAPFEGADAVVHLAGENITGRWTEAKKGRIQNSRVRGTETVAAAIARAAQMPRVLVAASAVGYYGNRGDEILNELSPGGRGFLPEVCRQWEAATQAAVNAGVRVVNMRIGVVLDARQGALAKMLPPFKMGVGGVIGSGRQYMPWIAVDDLVSAFLFALDNPGVQGAVNAVAPNPATNAEFTRTLGRVLGRPTIFPMPAFVVKLAFGEMGEELLLGGQRPMPVKLTNAGFRFRYPELEPALRALLTH